jgi:hypothetical protein
MQNAAGGVGVERGGWGWGEVDGRGWMEGTMQPCRYGLTAEVGRLYAFYLLFSPSKIHYFHPEIFHSLFEICKILLLIS